MNSRRVWFITGASSGIGLSMTKTVLDNGGIAIATLRKPSALDALKAKYPSNRLHILKLDVVNRDDIITAFKYAERELGRIDIVFNNAGHGIIAEIEGTPDDVAKKMFDVNFWGAMNVSKEAVRFFREVNKPQGGRLWNISSTAGIFPFASFGYYSASKHALEGATEAFAAELDPKWNIKVTLLEFGSFKTRIMQPESSPEFPVHPAYTDPTLMGNIVRGLKNNGTYGEADKATSMLFHRLANEPGPPLRIAVGLDANNSIKQKLKKVEADITKYESWSDDLH
ncbi:NAD(P)-binding protein [Thelephora ganbajun]|uniref:NAD(P)-binding protein n=1 Tax=Thelephora ganbajun TaxID=370292 RepID=A0ACB6ZH87_THEGA|nr:NAD(P)-binding protein [Thelephora ganbajun]